MSRMRSTKLWQALRRKSQPQPGVKEPAQNKKPVNAILPVEILEMIFIHLDFWTLLRCRNICRFWHDCIPGTSPILRNRMFLSTARTKNYKDSLPIEKDRDEIANFDFDVTIIDNFADKTDRYDQMTANYRDLAQPVTDYTVHFSKKRRTNSFEKSTGLFAYNPLLFLDWSRAQLRRYQATKAAVCKGELELPLWLGTHATSPPARSIKMKFTWDRTRLVQEECVISRHNDYFTIRDPRGVTMGRVLDFIGVAMWWPAMHLERRWEGKGNGSRLVRLIPCEEGDIRPWTETPNVAEVETTSDEGPREAAEAMMSLEGQFRQSTLLPRFEWEK